jgi:molybdopterin-guanine dinucleotide biosynthesis protein A
MGQPKATLDWHGTTLVEHVARIVAASVDGPAVVVGAPGQELPQLPDGVGLVRDAHAGRGPLEGIAAGLRALEATADAVFVAATDTPLLGPRVIQLVCRALSPGFDAAVPKVGKRMYPLTAAYRTSILALVEAHLAADRLRAVDLAQAMRVRWIGEPELRAVDPELASLRNLNTPEEYAKALASKPS